MGTGVGRRPRARSPVAPYLCPIESIERERDPRTVGPGRAWHRLRSVADREGCMDCVGPSNSALSRHDTFRCGHDRHGSRRPLQRPSGTRPGPDKYRDPGDVPVCQSRRRDARRLGPSGTDLAGGRVEGDRIEVIEFGDGTTWHAAKPFALVPVGVVGTRCAGSMKCASAGRWTACLDARGRRPDVKVRA